MSTMARGSASVKPADSWPAWTDAERFNVVEDDAPWTGFALPEDDDPASGVAAESAAITEPEPDPGRFGRSSALAFAPVDQVEAIYQAEALAELTPASVEATGPRVNFASYLEIQARAYRANGTLAADFVAKILDDLAAEVRFLKASGPADFDDRREQHERWLREQGLDV